MTGISHFDRSRSLKRLMVNGGMWGAYGQLVIVTGPIFTGLALWMGLQETDIATVAAVVGLAGLMRPFSFIVSRAFNDQRKFVIRFGVVEICLAVSVLMVPGITRTPTVRLVLLVLLTLGGTLMGHLVAPVFNSWFSTMIPEDTRAKFLGKRMIVVSLSAMAVSYLSGRFIDFVGEGIIAFGVPYLVAALAGIGGYLLLRRMPFPTGVTPERGSGGVSYATIGMLNVIVLAVGVLGYRIWGAVVASSRSKPVLQLLMVPRFLLPFAWVFLTPSNAGILLPVIMAVNGFVFSGLIVAINTLLFGTVPEGPSRPSFFAAWAFANALSFAYNAFLFSWMRQADRRAGTLRKMARSKSPMALKRLIEGVRDADPTMREQAVKGLGESGAEEAVDHLSAQLADDESDVRAEAAESLGRLRHPRGLDALLSAVDAEDTRVAMSAIRALGDLGGEEAKARLRGKLQSGPGKLLAPALIESLSRLGDIGVAIPGLEALRSYCSPVIRVQLLNCVCRALGGGNTFYELVSKGELDRSERLAVMVRRVERDLRRSSEASSGNVAAVVEDLLRSLQGGDYEKMPEITLHLVRALDREDERTKTVVDALKLYGDLFAEGVAAYPELMSVTCLRCAVKPAPARPDR